MQYLFWIVLTITFLPTVERLFCQQPTKREIKRRWLRQMARRQRQGTAGGGWWR